ncbi:hypothetical protein B4U79_18003 [Dinothrombium tinctorium]|uniref:Feline leukemia virus subgroup C receptor-related protein 2-like protein n=1 Tax=Dinothrombium tinctorium TaxID=1965070 RepID=A0A3S3P5J4_9ACAR|nr:hypothetical protein B4U79_18003 [Dinothrombium tinctorium]
MTLFITPTIAAVWFKSEESANILSIAQVALSLGFGVSFLPSMLIFKHANSIEEIRNGLSQIFIPSAIISVTLFFLSIFVVKAKPPTPPSAAQKLRESTKPNWKELIKNINFYYLSISYGILLASSQALLITLNQSVLKQFSHGETPLSISGFLLNGTGFFGTIIIKIVTKIFSNYKIINIVNCVTGCLIIFCYILMTYPFPCSIVFGIASAINSVFAIISTQLVTILMNRFGAVDANYILLVNFFIIILLSFLVGQDYRRRKANSSTQITISKEQVTKL